MINSLLLRKNMQIRENFMLKDRTCPIEVILWFVRNKVTENAIAGVIPH